MNIKFRQRFKHNKDKYHYWGNVEGVWINPKENGKFVSPEDSDIFTGVVDDNGVEVYVGDKVQIKFPYVWGDMFVREGLVKYSSSQARFYIDLEEDIEYFGAIDFEGSETPINSIKII